MEKGKKEKKHGATRKVDQKSVYQVTRLESRRMIGAVAPMEAKTSRGCGHQWIYLLLLFCAKSCILYEKIGNPKHSYLHR